MLDVFIRHRFDGDNYSDLSKVFKYINDLDLDKAVEEEILYGLYYGLLGIVSVDKPVKVSHVDTSFIRKYIDRFMERPMNEVTDLSYLYVKLIDELIPVLDKE